MSAEAITTYNELEADRVLGHHNGVLNRMHKILQKVQSQRAERVVKHCPISPNGRIGLMPKHPGFVERPLLVHLESIKPREGSIYITRPDGKTLARPYSGRSEFGIPFGEPAGEYSSLWLYMGCYPEDNRLAGRVEEGWEIFEGLSPGRPLEGVWPDVLHLANICLVGLEHPNTRPAQPITAAQTGIDKITQ